jgi:hypothetical protein
LRVFPVKRNGPALRPDITKRLQQYQDRVHICPDDFEYDEDQMAARVAMDQIESVLPRTRTSIAPAKRREVHSSQESPRTATINNPSLERKSGTQNDN